MSDIKLEQQQQVAAADTQPQQQVVSDTLPTQNAAAIDNTTTNATQQTTGEHVINSVSNTSPNGENANATTVEPSSVKTEASPAKANNAKKKLLEMLKGAVKKTENILESAAAAATPSKKNAGRPRKSQVKKERAATEPAAAATPAAGEAAAEPTTATRRSRRSRKSTQLTPEDHYELAEITARTLVGPFRTCYEILQQIKKDPWAWPFTQPVDYVGLNLPDYPLIIKNPMDLGTVQQKLTTGQYPTVYDFASDVRLIWQNCLVYNQPESDVAMMARKLQDLFEEKFKKVILEVESPSSASAKVREMQNQMQEMQAKIDSLATAPANGRYHVEGLPPGVIATPAPPAKPAAGARGRSSGGARSSGRKSASGGARGGRRKSATTKAQQSTAVDARPMTFEEKKELSELIGQLNNDQLATIVEIIQAHASRDEFSNQTESEIEIDLDQLAPVTLRELERFSKECLGLLAPQKRKRASATKKKSTPASKRAKTADSSATAATAAVQQQTVQHPDTDEETDDDSDSSSDSSGDELDSDSDDDRHHGPQSLSSSQVLGTFGTPSSSSSSLSSSSSSDIASGTSATQIVAGTSGVTAASASGSQKVAGENDGNTVDKADADADAVDEDDDDGGSAPEIITPALRAGEEEKISLQNENMWSATFIASDDEESKMEEDNSSGGTGLNQNLWSTFQQHRMREKDLEEQRRRELERVRRAQEEEHRRKLLEKEREEEEARKRLEEERERAKRERELYRESQQRKEEEDMDFDESAFDSFSGGSFLDV